MLKSYKSFFNQLKKYQLPNITITDITLKHRRFKKIFWPHLQSLWIHFQVQWF